VARYYSSVSLAPSELARREFGFGFAKKIDYRHKAFSSQRELSEFLRREAPFFVSYSAALYDLPAAKPMEKKGFKGADLVFDLDNSYLHEKHEHNPLLCTYCLNRVRDDALALVERFLLGDFGFSRGEVSVNYSGSKGYHVHVCGEVARQLSSEARKQLLSFISAKGIDFSRVLRRERFGRGSNAFVLRGPSASSRGWAKKLFEAASLFVERADLEHFKAEGVPPRKASALIENRGRVLEKMREGNWDAVKGLELVWEKLFRKAVALYSVQVDEAVTFDLARLIRLEDSIHGDTGFVARKVALQELAGFKPWEDALSARRGETAWVKPLDDLAFELGGEKYELKKGRICEVSEAAALFLACKKKVEVK
jgi:DNA primase small subunit